MKKTTEDIILSVAVFVPVVLLTLQVILNGLNLLTYEQTKQYNVIISAIITLVAFTTVIKRNSILLILSYFIVVLLLLFTVIIYPSNFKYIKEDYFNLLFVNIPAFLCVASISDENVLKKVMIKLAYTIFILGLIYSFLIFGGKIIFSMYNMSFSYYLLFPALIFASRFNLFHNILFFITLTLMLMYGSRGPLIIGIVYFLVVNVFVTKHKWRLFIVPLVLTAIIALFNFENLLILAESKLGYIPRTIRVMQENLLYDAGRFQLTSIIWQDILDGPFFGKGLFSDRVILPNEAYTHNILLELLHNFGFLVGGGLFIFLIFSMLKILKRRKKEEKIFFIFFIFYGFLPLFVSSSYLRDSKFWILLGAMFLLSKKKVQNTL